MREWLIRLFGVVRLGTLLLLFTLGLSACVKDPFGNMPTPVDGETLVTLRFRTPGNAAPKSKGLTTEQENAINDIDVLVFKGDPSNPRVIFHRQGTSITAGAAINEKSFNAVLPLSSSSDTKLVVLANSPGELAVSGGLVGKTYNEIQSIAAQSITGKLYPSGGAIPMWGETGFIEIVSGVTIPITLYRSVARVDIGIGRRADAGTAPSVEYSWDGLKADGATSIPFSLEEIYLISPNDKISLLPLPANWTATPMRPSVAGGKFSLSDSQVEFKFSGAEITNNRYTTRSIYLPESNILMGAAPGATRPGDANHRNRTALIMGGKYNGGATSYYRIDFTKGGYLTDVLRNHLYLISITNVTGSGYGTPEEAYNASAMNFNTEVEIWNEETINDIEFDGQYFFGIEKREVTFTPMGQEMVTYNVKSNVTDWSMSIAGTEVLNAATQRTYTNSTLGFVYTIAEGAQPDTYTLTVESTKHNIQSTPVRRQESLEIIAKRLVLPFTTTQESTDLFIGRQSSYRFYPEGSTVADQIEIDVASLTSVSVSSSDAWIRIASNTIVREVDGVYRGRITATVPRWLQSDGTTDRFGSITITPGGRPSISSTVTQEAPYIMFSETSVIVRALTRAADWSKILQVRTNLPVGSVDLTANHTADPGNRFSVVGGESSAAFSYPDNYYPRYASMMVEATTNLVETTNAATVIYTASGTTASTFSWVSGQTTLVIQPSETWYQWQWNWSGWPASLWNPSTTYVVPWHWNTVDIHVDSNRGVGYDLSHSWGSGIQNPTSAAVGATSAGTIAGATKYPVTFSLLSKSNAADSEHFGIYLTNSDALAHPVGLPIQFQRGAQVFSLTATAAYTWGWKGSSAGFDVTSNVEWTATASGLAVGIQQPSGGTRETSVVRNWKNNAAQDATTGNPNGATTQSMTIGTSQMAPAMLNNSSTTLSGSVTFTNNSGGSGAPTPATITINQYTPQLKLVGAWSDYIPNPIPSAGGNYTIYVSTNVGSARVKTTTAGNDVWVGATGVDESAGVHNVPLTLTVPANTGAQRNIDFGISCDLAIGTLSPISIPQASGAFNLTWDYNGRGGANNTVSVLANSVVSFPTHPTATGYTFGGWYDNPGFTGGAKVPGTYTMPSNNTTLYAKWTINQYTMTFNLNGGNIAGNGAEVIKTQNYESTLTAPSNPNRTGYTFNGWSPGVPATVPANNQVYTAQWSLVNYTLKYMDKFGGFSSQVSYNIESPTISFPTPSLGQYDVFRGWFTGLNGTGVRMNNLPTGSFGDITLYPYITNLYVINNVEYAQESVVFDDWNIGFNRCAEKSGGWRLPSVSEVNAMTSELCTALIIPWGAWLWSNNSSSGSTAFAASAGTPGSMEMGKLSSAYYICVRDI